MNWTMPPTKKLRAIYEPFDEDRFCEAGYQLESDDDPLSMTRETVREQRGRFETINVLTELVASGELTEKQAQTTNEELIELQEVYTGIYVSYQSAFGFEASEKLQRLVENNPLVFTIVRQLNLFSPCK